jgi:hypothetical protein
MNKKAKGKKWTLDGSMMIRLSRTYYEACPIIGAGKHFSAMS